MSLLKGINRLPMWEIEVLTIDIAQLRKKIGYSQSEFAKSIGVSKGTLLGWEQGRRRPTGAARVLLGMIDKRPSIVQELLSA
ncbi:helix-turn-helix domain-containing protein [Zymomonas mobilis]|nr:helix-turn-helix domain-containing protein [Zymomonas mobilis]MDX5947831.1 helix-turn-helix domain-containing protein [Zymomonas mobilis subsp. pomaceae]